MRKAHIPKLGDTSHYPRALCGTRITDGTGEESCQRCGEIAGNAQLQRASGITIHVDKKLEGTYIVERYEDASGFKLTHVSARQVIASAESAEALVKYAKGAGAKRVEIL